MKAVEVDITNYIQETRSLHFEDENGNKVSEVRTVDINVDVDLDKLPGTEYHLSQNVVIDDGIITYNPAYTFSEGKEVELPAKVISMEDRLNEFSNNTGWTAHVL